MSCGLTETLGSRKGPNLPRGWALPKESASSSRTSEPERGGAKVSGKVNWWSFTYCPTSTLNFYDDTVLARRTERGGR